MRLRGGGSAFDGCDCYVSACSGWAIVCGARLASVTTSACAQRSLAHKKRALEMELELELHLGLKLKLTLERDPKPPPGNPRQPAPFHPPTIPSPPRTTPILRTLAKRLSRRMGMLER